MRYATLFLALVSCSAGAAIAQELPGRNLTVTVHVRNITRSADTVTISYVLHNALNSKEMLVFFTVDAPVKPLTVFRPDPDSSWHVSTQFRTRTVAKWVALGGIAQGDTTPTLTFRARGLPAFVTAWYRGDSLPSIFEDDTAGVPNAPMDADPLLDLSRAIKTIGVKSSEGVTLVGADFKLWQRDLTENACSLEWISSSVCSNLLGHLDAEPIRILGYIRTLDSAYSLTSAVSGPAYQVLKSSTDYITTLEGLDAISMRYVCGNRFEITNSSFVPIRVWYQVVGTSESGSFTLAERTTDSPGHATQFLETMAYGPTVGIRHGNSAGRIIKAANNRNVPC
jgi:hypothetical protein